MELDTLPEHLLLLGGGYVGLEFAQMFRRLGNRVTILQRGPQLLPREDADIAEAVGVQSTGREVGVAYRSGGGVTATVVGSHLLVATGREPNTDDLNLGAAGVAHGVAHPPFRGWC